MSNKTLAMLFPGQGSQKVGMLAEFHGKFACFDETFTIANEVLGYDLWSLVQNDDAGKLNLTEVTQPALLTSSVALWRVWQELGGDEPSYMAGHSLGEWSALVCAGVLKLEDAIKLVQLRGKYMQEAVPVGEGAMAAIVGLSDGIIRDACKKNAEHGVVAPVNFNAPGQVVIAGEKSAVERAGEACKSAGAKRVLPLAVSAPFHTVMMKPAADRLAEDLQSIEFNVSNIPVVHNLTAESEADPARIKEIMIEQIYAPVRWVECMQKLGAVGVRSALECGPGKVLSGLMKRIDKSVVVQALETEEVLRSAAESIE